MAAYPLRMIKKLTSTNKLVDAIYQHGFHVVDDFLDYASYQALREKIVTHYNKGDFRAAKIGLEQKSTLNLNIRSDEIYWLDETSPDQALRAYFTEIKKISTHLNRSLFLGLVDYEVHFSVYQPGAFYKKHVDQFANKKNRRISCVYYLNNAWQQAHGGELLLYNVEEQLLKKIEPLANRFICFSSELPHEVCRTNHPRFAMAGWFKTNAYAEI